jgi:Zn-dependent peptidase ImmA (M78 family)
MSNWISDEEMERRAEALRDALQMLEYGKLDGFLILRALKQNRFLRDYVILPDVDLGDAAGRYSAEEKIIYLSQKAANALRAGEGRALWTIAHEVGHLAFGHSTRDRKTSGAQHSLINQQLNRDEIDAHRFAASFLAPARLAAVTQSTTSSELASRFGLSLEAAERRRLELLQKHNQQAGIKRQLPNNVLDFLAESARRGTEIRPSLKLAVQQHKAPPKYVGDPCPNPHCGELKMVRSGLITVCQACGTQTGID